MRLPSSVGRLALVGRTTRERACIAQAPGAFRGAIGFEPKYRLVDGVVDSDRQAPIALVQASGGDSVFRRRFMLTSITCYLLRVQTCAERFTLG